MYCSVLDDIQNQTMRHRSVRNVVSPGSGSTRRQTTRTHWARTVWRNTARTSVWNRRMWWCLCWRTRCKHDKWVFSLRQSGWKDWASCNVILFLSCRINSTIYVTNWMTSMCSRGYTDTLMISRGLVLINNTLHVV